MDWENRGLTGVARTCHSALSVLSKHYSNLYDVFQTWTHLRADYRH